MAGREDNIRIFEDTRHMYETDPQLVQAVADSVKRQQLILESDALPAGGDGGSDHACWVIVSRNRTLQAAALYPGRKVCVLNFASATNPGGGVTRGSSAQEEAICRCSTLYPCLTVNELKNGFYLPHRQLPDTSHNDDCIYTPDVVVFKSDTASPRSLPEKEWYRVNVITCAAPNLRKQPYNAMNPGRGRSPVLKQTELLELHIRRGRRIFETARAFGNQVLILGAFGCGAFQNPPETVARAYAGLVREYSDWFEAIEFAVYCRPDETRNYDAFVRRMRGERKKFVFQ